MEFDQELKKLKEEWNQERLKTNEQHNAQISICGAKMKTLHQYHHVNMSILQAHLVIQCSPIFLTQMTIIQ